MEGSASEAPCAICRGVGLTTAEFHYALAGDQESHIRHEDILQRANELRDLREELNRVTAMMASAAAVYATTPAGLPASLVNAGLVTEAATLAGAPATDVPIPLVAETGSHAGAPARSAPPSVPVNDTWLGRMERATDRSAQWLQSSRSYMPYGLDLRSRSQRRTESPVSMRSGNSGISEREMLHAVLMINTDGQMSMRAEED
eukprot:4094516-Pyramimonas_sp.AAC.1